MDYETLLTIAEYGKFFILIFVFVVFYGYAYSIYKREKSGERNFEKYSSLVLDDSYDSQPLEQREAKNKKGEK